MGTELKLDESKPADTKAQASKSVSCPVESTLAVLAGRWKVLVLHHLLAGTKRFGELHRLLPTISHRTLAKQLRELERDGIVSRRVFPQIPPKVEYSLTPLGESLEPVLRAMHEWGVAYVARVDTATPAVKSPLRTGDT
jgi:DNA-binding HxlR family transcriptional regulator